jgi:hypothetical protein
LLEDAEMLKSGRCIREKYRAAAQAILGISSNAETSPPSFSDDPTEKTTRTAHAAALQEASNLLEESSEADVVTQVVRVRNRPRSRELLVIRYL